MRTANFTVVSRAGADEAVGVADALEAFREAFRRLMPRARVDPPAPTIVFVFDRFESFEPYAPRYGGRTLPVAGSFIGAPDANYLTLTLSDRSQAWGVVYHELTHLFVNQSLQNVPAWFNEGLAEYYSTFALSTDRPAAELGHAIPGHVTLLAGERWLPLDDLLEVTTSSALYNERERRSMFYAQSWALVHFLLGTGPNRSAQLLDYLGRVTGGQTPASAVRAAFGMTSGSLEDEVRRYVEQGKWAVQRHGFGTPLGSARASAAEPLSDAAAHASLAGLLLRLGRPDEALALAQAATREDEQSAEAWAMFAALGVGQELGVEALPFLERALTLRLAEPVPAYHAGVAALRVYEQAGPSAIARRDAVRMAKAALDVALSAVPAYAEAWAGLAHASLLDGGEADRALVAARRARTLAPRRDNYVLLEAQALMQAGDLVAARHLLEETLARPIDTMLADRLAELVTRVNALER